MLWCSEPAPGRARQHSLGAGEREAPRRALQQSRLFLTPTQPADLRIFQVEKTSPPCPFSKHVRYFGFKCMEANSAARHEAGIFHRRWCLTACLQQLSRAPQMRKSVGQRG